MSDLFAEDLIPTKDEPVIDVTKNYLEDLVGDGKTYADNEALARAAMEKELHIRRIEKENSVLRTNSAAQQKLEELVTKLAEARSPSTEPNRQEPDVSAPPIQNLEEQFEALYNKRSAEARHATNRDHVKQVLQQNFGSNYVQRLNQVSAETGMSPEQMNALAATAPSALLKLVGVDRPAQQMSAPPVTQVNTQADFKPNKGEKTQSYYRSLLKTSRNEYLSARVQNEMMANAKRLGPAFFD